VGGVLPRINIGTWGLCAGAARTILLFHTISARSPKQPRMVRTFIKVHTRPMHCGAEVTESSTNKRHHLSLWKPESRIVPFVIKTLGFRVLGHFTSGFSDFCTMFLSTFSGNTQKLWTTFLPLYPRCFRKKLTKTTFLPLYPRSRTKRNQHKLKCGRRAPSF
jgi:hypothetical protein